MRAGIHRELASGRASAERLYLPARRSRKPDQEVPSQRRPERKFNVGMWCSGRTPVSNFPDLISESVAAVNEGLAAAGLSGISAA